MNIQDFSVDPSFDYDNGDIVLQVSGDEEVLREILENFSVRKLKAVLDATHKLEHRISVQEKCLKCDSSISTFYRERYSNAQRFAIIRCQKCNSVVKEIPVTQPDLETQTESSDAERE